MENKNEMTQEVTLITAQLLNFKADDGNTIQGIKLYYLVNSDNDFYSNGKVEDVFFKTLDIDSAFKKISNFHKDCINFKDEPKVKLIFTIESIKSRPKLVNIIY